MRLDPGRRSSNVEDRRAEPARGGAGLKIGGGAALLLAVVVMLMGGDPRQVLRLIGGQAGAPAAPAPPRPISAGEQQRADFVSAVLADTEASWPELLRARGARYAEPKLVLFRDAVQSACGFAEAAVGPFYCPLDQKAYLDLSFFDELHQRFGAPGDFAQAYVLAHEIGHHVQALLGTSARVHEARRRAGTAEGNRLSVLLELQADCYAGLWAHHAAKTRQVLEPGDVEEGLAAAAAIGDDRLQRQARGQVVPESFTHGSSAQRVAWFRRGLERGALDDCDTFAAGGP